MSTYSGYRHYAGLHGTKEIYVGADESVYQYTDLASAVSAAQNNDVIILTPGTYSLTATLAITKPLTIKGLGKVFINGGTAGIATALITINQPASYSGSVYVTFENIDISNAYSNTTCIDVDNDGGANQVMYVEFNNCSVAANGTGMAINVDQTSAYHIYFKCVSNRLDTLTLTTVSLKKAASEAWFIGMKMGVLALGTTDVASVINMVKCAYASAAQTSGGSASLIFNSWDCVKLSSGAIVAQALADFDATSASENVTTNTILT